MPCGNIVNQFLDKNRFTNSRTTEKSRLTPFRVGTKQVNDLDTGFKHVRGRCHLAKDRWWSVYWIVPYPLPSLTTGQRSTNTITAPSLLFYSNQRWKGSSHYKKLGS